jgi:hypothetical protein
LCEVSGRTGGGVVPNGLRGCRYWPAEKDEDGE